MLVAIWKSDILFSVAIWYRLVNTDTDTKQFNRYQRVQPIPIHEIWFEPIPIPRISTDIYRYFVPSLEFMNYICLTPDVFFRLAMIAQLSKLEKNLAIWKASWRANSGKTKRRWIKQVRPTYLHCLTFLIIMENI